MNRLQSELQANRVASARAEEPEVFALCGVDVAFSLLSLSGIDRIIGRSMAITNARFDRLQSDLEHVYVEASVKLIEAQNKIGHRVEGALDRLAYAEEYGIDDADDPKHIAAEGRWLRLRDGKFPSAAYSD